MTDFPHISSTMQFIRISLLATVFTLLSLSSACASGSDSGRTDTEATGADNDLSEVSRILAPNESFILDDYVAAGWKKSKQYDIGTVPQAIDIWYGFFSAKDIEIRFYESHEIAKTAGLENAATAIDLNPLQKKVVSGGSAVTKYKAFVVVGNTVLLCEQSIDSCIALTDVLGN
jgi:hypothetical protein